MASATETASQIEATIRAAFSHVHAEAKELEEKMAEWAELQDRIKQTVANAPNIVKLNVGGTMFETSKATLLRVEGSYFHALLGSGNWKPDDTTNAYFLDMDPKLFRRVLIYLRTGTLMPTNSLTKVEREELKAMMEYLKVSPLGGPMQLIRWNVKQKASDVTLSNDLRTVEKSSNYHHWGGVIATEALEGTFRIRIDVAASDFVVALCPLAIFGCNSWDNVSRHCYGYYSTGSVNKKQSTPEQQANLKVGDVVTIQRGEADAVFTVNDGTPVQVALVDPNEVLFPVVFMCSVGTKVTVVD